MQPDNRMSRQLWCWLVLAVSAPLMEYAVGGFMVTALAAGAMLPLSLLVTDGFERMGKLVSFVEWIWAGVVLTNLLPASGHYWPAKGSELAVPLILLALAAFSGETERLGRACSSLCWLAGGVFAVVALSALGKLEPAWMEPVRGTWSPELMVTMLLPALGPAVCPQSKGKTGVVLAVAALAVGISALIQGCLGVGVGRNVAAPMYEVGRTLGSAYELLVSVGVSFGWYAAACLLLSCAGAFGENWGLTARTGRYGAAVLASILILLNLKIKGTILVGGCLLGWILLPLLSRENKSKKEEKRY